MLFRKATAASFILTGTALLLILVFAQGIAAGTTLKETPLNEAGRAYELFRAGNGELWISDWLAGEMWRVNPNTNAFTIYEGLLGASDGRLDSSGDLWWSNLDDSQLGHLVSGANTATIWSLPPDSNPIGLAFDAGGNVWVTASNASLVYRFVPGTQELCSFPVPDDGAADYLLFHSGHVWLGDWALGRILRLDPTSGSYSMWKLSNNSYPEGLAFDAGNHLWWADNGLDELGQLDPQSNAVTTYLVPGANPSPVQVSILEGKVWYSDENGSVGALDPAVAMGSSEIISPSTTTVSPTCQTVTGSELAVTTRSGTAGWSPANFTLAQNSGGWTIYQLPAGAAPYGLATASGNVWFADQGEDGGPRTQQLGWLELAAPVTCYQLARNYTGPGAAPVALPTNSDGCTLDEYVAGENIALTAHPATGAGVTSWNGTNNDSSTSINNSVTMPAGDHTVAANYELLVGPCYLLSRAHTGAGGDPIASPLNSSGCSPGAYKAREAINVTAAPDGGWKVSSWNGTNNNSSTAISNTVTMPSASHTVTVNYEERTGAWLFLPSVIRSK